MIIKAGDSVICAGRAGGDAKRYSTQRGKSVTKFSIPVSEKTNEQGEKETLWMEIVAFGSLADAAGGVRKGNNVFVAGKYELNNYTTKDGVEKSTPQVVADYLSIQSASGSSTVASSRPAAAPSPNIEYDELVTDEDLPF